VLTFRYRLGFVRFLSVRGHKLRKFDARLQLCLQNIKLVQEENKLDLLQNLVTADHLPEPEGIGLREFGGLGRYVTEAI
jgi:hypothetical protein